VFRIRIGLDPETVKILYFWSSKIRIWIQIHRKAWIWIPWLWIRNTICQVKKLTATEQGLLRIFCFCYEILKYFFCFSSPSTLCEYSQNSGQAHLLPRNPQKNCFKSGNSSWCDGYLLFGTVPHPWSIFPGETKYGAFYTKR
jgi:hypothetical protein